MLYVNKVEKNKIKEVWLFKPETQLNHYFIYQYVQRDRHIPEVTKNTLVRSLINYMLNPFGKLHMNAFKILPVKYHYANHSFFQYLLNVQKILQNIFLGSVMNRKEGRSDASQTQVQTPALQLSCYVILGKSFRQRMNTMRPTSVLL